MNCQKQEESDDGTFESADEEEKQETDVQVENALANALHPDKQPMTTQRMI